MNRAITGLIALSLIGGLESCRLLNRKTRKREVLPVADSTQVAVDTALVLADTVAAVVTDTVAPAINPEKQALITSLLPLLDRQFAWQTFSSKTKMHYEGKGESHDFTAFFRIEKDKQIWVNVTAAGGLVSVARALITPDSIKARVDLNNTAYVLPFSEAKSILPVAVDFSTLQDLIVGNAFRNGGIPVDATDFGGGLMLAFADADFRQQITYNKVDSTMRQQQLMPLREGSPALMLQYGGYEVMQNRRFSKARVINIDDKGEHYYLDMEFNRVDFDQVLEYPFSIPSKYELK